MPLDIAQPPPSPSPSPQPTAPANPAPALSPARLAANRANALRSTGPRTPAGKAASSRNALRHGLSAKTLCLPTEDPEEFRRFAAALARELDPGGFIEGVIAERIIATAWRLRRAVRVERDVLLYQGAATKPDGSRRYAGEATALFNDGNSRHKSFEKIGRYESRLHSQLTRDLNTLRSLQRDRAKNPP